MDRSEPAITAPIDALIVALPETAGSALYGMIDVLAATGTLWQELVGDPPGHRLIRPRIVSPERTPFRCGNAIPVEPELCTDDDPHGEVVILPELWLAPDDDLADRHETLKDWIRRRHRAGSTIYTACSWSVLLAATGLLTLPFTSLRATVTRARRCASPRCIS
jgi:transcriptional regulator GlxA family with amidase domain